MGGVGDELLLPVAGVLEPAEHLVHGQREPVDLVARARLRHPPVQPVAGDLLDLAPDALDRCERPGGHHPGGAADEQQHQRQPDQQRRYQRRGRVVDLLERDGDRDDVLLPSPGVLGHHEVAVVGARQPAPRRRPRSAAARLSGWEARTTVPSASVTCQTTSSGSSSSSSSVVVADRGCAGRPGASRSGRPATRPAARRWSPARRARSRRTRVTSANAPTSRATATTSDGRDRRADADRGAAQPAPQPPSLPSR